MASYQTSYRPEIDGLRAFAVLSVVIFHAFPDSLQGGFIGVDVFFVISGFLITSHIFENLDKQKFSFSDFFGRRIRRIFPALIVVMAFSLALGWFVLISDEYRQLGGHVAAGSFFIQNFVLVNESGYFDNAAETKPMLHLWSLAVEEQFYIIWPLVLWASWKRQFNLLTVTIAVGLLSFAINLQFSGSHPTEAFFLPFGRFWELLAGSILAWLTLYKKETLSQYILRLDDYLVRVVYTKKGVVVDGSTTANLTSFLGLLLLTYGIFIINKDLAFPGGWALIPVIGSVLVIASGPKAWFNRILLMNPIAIWIGLISYPLYLWHWPILSFLQIIKGKIPHHDARLVAVLLSFVLAWLTYRFIERFIRRKKVSTKLSVSLSLVMLVVAVFGYSAKYFDGYPHREVVQLSTINPEDTGVGELPETIKECGVPENIARKIAFCFRDQRDPIKYVMIGDSKSASLISGTVRKSTQDGRWMMIGGFNEHGAVGPFISTHPYFKQFQQFIPVAVDSVNAMDNIEVAVLVGAARTLGQYDTERNLWGALDDNHSSYEEGTAALERTVERLVRGGNKKVVLVVDNPPLGDSKTCGVRTVDIPFVGLTKLNSEPEDCSMTLEEYYRLRSRYIQSLESIAAKFGDQVRIFDTAEIFCDTERGLCLRFKNGRSSFGYTDHMSDYMSGLVGVELNRFLAEWLSEEK